MNILGFILHNMRQMPSGREDWSLLIAENLFYGLQICHPVYSVWFKVAPFCPFIPAINIKNILCSGVLVKVFPDLYEGFFEVFRCIAGNRSHKRVAMICKPVLLVGSWTAVPSHGNIRVVRQVNRSCKMISIVEILILHIRILMCREVKSYMVDPDIGCGRRKSQLL